MNQIGVGIIGSGKWGRKLAAGYLDAERKGRVRLIKVCDNSVAALGTLLLDHETACMGEDRLSAEVRDIMENADISAVHVATPSQTHSELVRMALQAGKNVFVEKPVSLNSLECQELVDLAAEKGLVIEDGNYGFDSCVQAAIEVVRRGDLGRILYVGVQWTGMIDATDKDVLFELGPAPIAILNSLLGTWPQEVSGVAGAYRASTGSEVVQIFAQYPDDIFAQIELNGIHPREMKEIFIVGSSATLDIDCLNQRVVEYSPPKITEIPVSPNQTITHEIDHFIDRITHGDCTVDQAMARTVESIEAVQSSLLTKVPSIKRSEGPQKATQSEMASLETAVGLLEIVHKGVNKTPIKNEGEVNPDLVRRYFVMLEKIGLVDGWDRSNQEKTYSLTTKGLQFLVDYYESQRLGEITDNTRRVLQAVGLG